MSSIQIRRGDTWPKRLTITQGGPVNLANVSQIWMTFRRKPAKPGVDTDDTSAVLQVTLGSGITVFDAAEGEADVALTPAQTSLLVKDSYYFDVQIKMNTGEIFTTDDGYATILDQATLSG